MKIWLKVRQFCLGAFLIVSNFWIRADLEARTVIYAELASETNLSALNLQLRGLQSGDQICWANSCLTLKEHLGAGRTAQIWSVKEYPQYAVRLPKGHTPGVDLPLKKQIEMMATYRLGMLSLREDKISVPQIVSDLEGFGLLIERIDYEFRLRRFLDPESDISETKFEEALAKLKLFIASIAIYENLGDFHPDQLVYSLGGEWVLLDIDGKPTRFKTTTRMPIISLSDTRGLSRQSILDRMDFRFAEKKQLYERAEIWFQIRSQLYEALNEARRQLGLQQDPEHSFCLHHIRERVLARLRLARRSPTSGGI